MKNYFFIRLSCRLNLPRSHRANGFTLVELIIAVAIVGILATIALPSYKSYVLRSRRTEAMTELTKAQAVIERCYAANFTYIASLCPAAPSPTPQGFYTMTSVSSATTYTFTATALGSQTADTLCATMSIDQASQKLAADIGGTAQPSCWNR